MILVLAIIGVLGIAFGILATSRAKALAAAHQVTSYRKVALALGLVIALPTCPGTLFMGYPYQTPEGTGRVVGIPFIVAFFNHQGFDYVGPLSVPAAIANMAFWFLVPQIVLFVYLRTRASGKSRAE